MNTPLNRRRFIAASCATAGIAALASTAAPAPAESATMPRRPYGKLGWMVSLVGFGGGSQFMSQSDETTVELMLHRAVELGINYFDTAFTYLKSGQRESIRRYGKYLVPRHRNQIHLVSKLEDRNAESAERNFEVMLKELGTDHLEVLHFHALGSKDDIDKIVAKGGALKVYRTLKEQGVIKAIGITGHVTAAVLIDAIERIEPDCVMCPQNPAHSGQFDGSDFARVIPIALKRGMGMVAMKTTGRNGLIGKNGVTAEQLVSYSMNLPVATAVIGMPSLEVLESCASVARTLKPLGEDEKKELEQRLASARTDAFLPYLAAGYKDGPALT